jgi:zinc protease
VLVEPSHAIPLVGFTVAFRSGSAYDPVGREGSARVAARMLRRGCDGLSANDIEERIDQLGGELSFDVSASSVALHAQVIGRNLRPFIELVARILSLPSFAEAEFERLRREVLAELVESRDNDRGLAQKAFRAALFGGHPYGRSTMGTMASVQAVTLDDVRAAYAQHFVRKNAVIGFSGDITGPQAGEVAEMLLHGLPKGALRPEVIPEPSPIEGRHLIFVDKPDRTQTQILIGSLGTSPFDDDHVALGAANAVFGGTFTSRLMREVRSKRGWSYGASARLGVGKRRQAFSMWTFPAATDAAACIELELGLLEAFVDKGITERELSFIKRYLTRSYAFDVDTASKRLHQALDVEVLGLPSDYYSGYVGHVQRVTLEQANRAVQKRIDPSRLLVVVVGTAGDLLDAVRSKVGGLARHDVVSFEKVE